MKQVSWVHEAFRKLDFGRVPDRRLLQAAFKASPIPPACPLVLLFGSAARGESASDIDIVILLEYKTEPYHEYERLVLNGIALDLNFVDTDWLARAPLDLEQSYWLSESYPLFARSDDWLKRWVEAANSYWTIDAVKRRRRQFADLVKRYAEASRSAFRLGLERTSRLAAHEAARAYICDLMDQDGAATHSHGLVACSIRQGVLAKAPQHLRVHLEKCLLADASPDALSVDNYLTLRRTLSTFRRAVSTLQVLGLRSLNSRNLAAAALEELIPISGADIEDLLSGSDFEQMLPREFPSQLTEVVEHTIRKTSAERRRIQDLSIPVRGNIEGARWVERTADRLKIIINTGGCKTPTCTFCSLPQFARRMPRRAPADVVRSALTLQAVSRIALYNDGNFLNEAEISVQDRRTICAAILERQIRSLTIESAPRFVTERKLRDVQAWSGVYELVVAMGLQTAGSRIAAHLLGRPDVDAIFNFAIDEIHAANAAVRLYVLHGYGRDFSFWDERLVESVEWAGTRGVELVSICPYVDPGGAEIDHAHVTHLETLVSTLVIPQDMTLEIVGRGLTSCGNGARGAS